MAQKITGYVKLQIPAGKATPAPPVGPALGQHGVNIMQATINRPTPREKYFSIYLLTKILRNIFIKSYAPEFSFIPL